MGRFQNDAPVEAPSAISLDGQRKRRSAATRSRLRLTMLAFALVYGAIGTKLVVLGMTPPPVAKVHLTAQDTVAAARPGLFDRNGEMLATDITTASLFAEPRKIIDPDEAVEALSTVLPDLDYEHLRSRLASDAGFLWIKREIMPKQQSEILRLGIPGINFVNENKRFYPGGLTAAHVLGHVNVDNRHCRHREVCRRAGLVDLQELGFAKSRSSSLEPVKLSIDLRAQHVLRDELGHAMEAYQAIAALGVARRAHRRSHRDELAVGLRPEPSAEALQKDRINRVTAGVPSSARRSRCSPRRWRSTPAG
ncbi:MAG: hypothetical protein R3D02_00655 [Hyphomicrobiales bacterium]